MRREAGYTGVVDSVIYHNNENGFTVFSILTNSEEEDELVCTGYLPALSEGERIEVEGFFVVHPVYGKQLSVENFKKTVPDTLEGIEKYLASGVIKGIGDRLAKRIVKEFGENTFDVIENYPEKLAEIRGITPERAEGISAVFHEQAELRRAMLFLQDYGITPVYALKIYKRYRESTVEIVKHNPYSLSDDIYGIGFKTADAIAFKVGIAFDSPYRIQAGIRYVLSRATLNGHVYLPRPVLMEETAALLGIDAELIANHLTQLQIDRHIWQENINGPDRDQQVVYLNAYYYAENYVAKKLLELSGNAADKSADVAEEIRRAEEADQIFLAENQRKAVMEAVQSGVLVITGGPGTGKTTTINTIIRILQKHGSEIELAAPTGRAAKRMSEATGMEAKTLHRLLGISFMSEDSRRQTFDRDEDNPIETDVIIVDESSMVDILLMNSFLKAVAPGTRLILVGDVDQLPSVGPGNVLKDIIQSGIVPVVRLTEIFRQAQESAIVMNAHRINNGEYPVINEKNKDFFFVRRNRVEDVVSTILELVTTRLPGYMTGAGVQDIQVLTPMRKSPLGVTQLNTALQNRLNPPSAHKKEKEFRSVIFREGDKVMQIKNNYGITWQTFDENNIRTDEGLGIFNGDCGVIQRIDDAGQTVNVLFDDNKSVAYDYGQLDEIELAYAVTIHKSQGSEYRIVVIPIHSGPPMLMNRNLLYTGVTRAKDLVVLVGTPECLNKRVDNCREIARYTSLCHRIKKMETFLSDSSDDRKDESE